MEDVTQRNDGSTEGERGASVNPSCLTWGLGAAIIAGLIVSWVVTGWRSQPAPPLPHTPQYKAGECFVSNEPRESWEPAADGIIIQVGKEKYLYEPWELAARNSNKKPWRREKEYAIPISIKTLDSTSHKVECPTKGVTYYN